MKKISKIIVAVALCIMLVACGSKSAIQEATGANAAQNAAITENLEAAGIDYEMINAAVHNKPNVLLEDEWSIYNVIDREGVNYFLVLNSKHEVVAILSSEAAIITATAEYSDLNK